MVSLGAPAHLFDEVLPTRPLVGPALQAAATSTRWTDRCLGSTAMIDAPMRTVFFATGNGLTVSGDMGRRAVTARLLSPHKCPETHTDFAVADLPAHVAAQRAE